MSDTPDRQRRQAPQEQRPGRYLANMAALHKLTGNSEWLEKAQTLAAAVAGTVALQPTAFTYFLTGLDALRLLDRKSSPPDSLP